MYLSTFMEQNTVTVSEISEKTGLDRSTVIRHLAGNRISSESALKYKQAFPRISIEKLLEGGQNE